MKHESQAWGPFFERVISFVSFTFNIFHNIVNVKDVFKNLFGKWKLEGSRQNVYISHSSSIRSLACFVHSACTITPGQLLAEQRLGENFGESSKLIEWICVTVSVCIQLTVPWLGKNRYITLGYWILNIIKLHL